MTSTVETKTIPITRMECPTCIPLLEREVQQLEGVTEARGNYINKTVKVTFDPTKVQLDAIEAAIERIGYRIAYKKYSGLLSQLKRLFAREEHAKITPLQDADFPEHILTATRPVAVLFSSQTCPACRMFKAQFTTQMDTKDNADFYELDVASTETWQKYDIQSIPTVLVFNQGQLAMRFDALPNIDDITHSLDNIVKHTYSR